jgi:uncharacterized repeat protein (TIGR03803 family)
MSKLSSWKAIFLLCVFCAVTAISSPAQTFTTLVNFNGTDGNSPNGLVQGADGNLYGTTESGGAYGGGGDCGSGTVFQITPTGALTTLYSFGAQTNCVDGADPYAGLVLATDGNFYGTTWAGGANNDGTVFKITPGGTLTTLHSFDLYTDGCCIASGLVRATDGNFYGTTSYGGAKNGGTVFKISPGGTLTTLYSFCSQTNCTDGSGPFASLVQATNGRLYGTSSGGGAHG